MFTLQTYPAVVLVRALACFRLVGFELGSFGFARVAIFVTVTVVGQLLFLVTIPTRPTRLAKRSTALLEGFLSWVRERRSGHTRSAD